MAGLAVTVGVTALVVNAICYMIMTLIRIGKFEEFRTRELMNLSLVATLVVASLAVVFRFFTRVY